MLVRTFTVHEPQGTMKHSFIVWYYIYSTGLLILKMEKIAFISQTKSVTFPNVFLSFPYSNNIKNLSFRLDFDFDYNFLSFI